MRDCIVCNGGGCEFCPNVRGVSLATYEEPWSSEMFDLFDDRELVRLAIDVRSELQRRFEIVEF